MSKTEYCPKPLLICKEELPSDFERLIEILSENVHEQWSTGRLEKGWKYGLLRNDLLKRHPSLVPYNQLPEQEKEYDRMTVMATLSALILNGYEIKRK